ncbi:MAG: S-methyl-5-thioribose-1-phosphate isomerase, partial [Actinomycetota bacterium]
MIGDRPTADRDDAGGIRPVEWLGDRLRLLDQTKLPAEERYLDAVSVDDVVRAIRRLAIRGAPLLGIAAAYGVALAAARSVEGTGEALTAEISRAAGLLVASRPTAVNIGWAVERVVAATRDTTDPAEIRSVALAEARAIEAEEVASCRAIARAGAALIPTGANVMTICNTGVLATGGCGTAQGVIAEAHRQRKNPHVWMCETRPLLQGARLTAWELGRLGIRATLLADSAASTIMAARSVDVVVVGADRIAGNGD